MSSKYLWMLLLLAQVSIQQKDPVANFCRRFGHQTTAIDSRLYIDGGQINLGTIRTNITNQYLSYHDLTTSPAQIEMPQLNANLSKNASIPSTSGGQLWADAVNKRFYLYGGESLNTPPTSPQEIYSYDILNNQWDNFGSIMTGVNIVSWGAGVGVSSLGQGFVYGGWLSNTSVPGWTGPPMATNSLIRFDMGTKKFDNISGPADNLGRAEGVMVYVPASNDGLLVSFGGLQSSANGSMAASPMDSIRIHDIRSQKWYTQKATGDVPPNRRRFCADAAWSDDQSSYNIYLYGGLGFDDNTAGFDDLWILSLPSFKWVNYYKGAPGSPHHSLSCNIVGKGQMLVIGGTFPVNDTCDSPDQWGVHNSDISKSRGHAWEVYDPNITTYSVPPEVINIVGGAGQGGASVSSPAGGFQDPELGVYFGQKATVHPRTPTRAVPTSTGRSGKSSSAMKLARGAIAGIAVGGGILLSSIIVGLCLCLRRRNKSNDSGMTLPPPPPAKAPPRIPQRPQEHLSPSSHYSHPFQQKPQSAQPLRSQRSHYQLPTTPEPVELYGSHYVMDRGETTGLGMREVNDSDHPAPPLPSNLATSPNPSHYSEGASFYSNSRRETFGTPVSVAPKFTTLGRNPTNGSSS